MTIKEIDLLLQQGEGYNLEFKEGYSKSIPEEVCAFSNSAGGIIIIGIRDNNSVCGIHFDNKHKSQLQQSIDAVNPRPEFSITEHKYQDKTIVLIDCKSGSRKPYLFSGCVYVRNGANTQKLTTAVEMRDFFQQQQQLFFDESPCKSFNYPADFDSTQFKRFLKMAKVTTSLPEPAYLKNFSLFSENDILKNGAILFFAKDLSKHFEHAMIRCLLFKGTDKRYILDDKIYTGNVIQQFDDAVLYIKSKLELRYDIESQGAGPRKEILEIPELVFKEALLNALAHRDYYEKGAVIHVEIFDDRIDISNPGGLISAISLKEFGKKSISRNPLVFGLLQRAGLVEKAGTGIQRMRKLMTDEGLAEPVFSTEGMFTVSLYRPINFEKWIAKAMEKLTTNQIEIIKAIHKNKRVTIKELSKRIKISDTAIDNNIQKLRNLGIIERVGSDKDGYWQVKPTEYK